MARACNEREIAVGMNQNLVPSLAAICGSSAFLAVQKKAGNHFSQSEMNLQRHNHRERPVQTKPLLPVSLLVRPEVVLLLNAAAALTKLAPASGLSLKEAIA